MKLYHGQTSELSGTIQNDRYGYKGVRLSAMEDVKQITMAGSPVYTADVDLTSTYGTNTDLNGTVTGANSGSTLTVKATLFTEQLNLVTKLHLQMMLVLKLQEL